MKHCQAHDLSKSVGAKESSELLPWRWRVEITGRRWCVRVRVLGISDRIFWSTEIPPVPMQKVLSELSNVLPGRAER